MEPQFTFYTDIPWADMVNQIPLIPLVAISLTFVLLFLVALGGIGVAFVKAVRGGGTTRKLRAMEAEEIKAFQSLQRGFSRMHERLESLETLYMGRSQGELADRELD